MLDWLKAELHNFLAVTLVLLIGGVIKKKGLFMEKKLVDGAELDVDMKIEGGKIILMPVYAGAGGYAKLELGLDGEYFLKQLASKIPGVIDDAIIAVAIEAIKKV